MAGVAKKARGQETVRDLVLSLLVLMGGVALVWAVLPRGHHAAVTVVATGETVHSFAGQAAYQPYVPAGLPSFWKATSVNATVPADGAGGSGASGPVPESAAARLTIGYVVDRSGSDRTFAELDQTNATDAVGHLVPEGSALAGSVTVGGVAWQRYRDPAGHLALTRTNAGVTLVVGDGGGKGGADEADLRVLAGSLVQAQP